jgi:hypothetical protein
MFYNSLLCEDGETYKDGRCVNEQNRVNWYYNGVATGYDNKAIDEYFTKNSAYKLPLFENLTDNQMTSMCYLHHRAWCYRTSDKDLNCIPFASISYDTAGTCGDPAYNTLPRTVMLIPSADVNTMISRGDTSIYLSVAPNNGLCVAKGWTILNENGCACMSGQMTSDGVACTQPTGMSMTDSCPAGYDKENHGTSSFSCIKPGITLKEVK